LQLRNWEELDVQVIPEPIRPTLSIADAQVIEGSTLTFTVSVDKADPSAQITATYTDGASLDDLSPGTPLTGTGRKQIILVSDIATKGLNYISIMPNYFRPL
jgi:hypothetical protein